MGQPTSGSSATHPHGSTTPTAPPESLPLTLTTTSTTSRSHSRSPTPATTTPPPMSTFDIPSDALNNSGSNNNPKPSRSSTNTSTTSDDSETTEADEERSPMLARWEQGRSQDDLVRIDNDDDDDNDDHDDHVNARNEGHGWDEGEEGEMEDRVGVGLGGQWESSAAGAAGGSWTSEGSRGAGSGRTPGAGWTDHHLTRGQKRRVYGGGRNGDAMQGGGLTAGEVAGLLLAGTLGPTPLLLPHAAALLGLPLFLPLLFVTALLSWVAYLVLGVEGRYVGARTWPALASAVFPHRFKLHRGGELLAAVLELFVALARGIVGIVAASEVVVDLMYPAGGRRWLERVVGIAIIAGSFILVPLVIMPFIRNPSLRRRPTHPNATQRLHRVPSYITLTFWPLALLILGVRLKTLNSLPPSDLSLTTSTVDPTQPEAMGLSIWGGVSILVFSLSAHQDTFRYLTSLARPPSTASRLDRSPHIGSIGSSSASSSQISADIEGRRNQWPLASAFGVGGSVLLQMGWGLVGYLGIDGGGREGNLFASDKLPRGDGWLFIVRVLVLVAIVVGLEGSLDTAVVRIRKGLVFAFGPEREVGTPSPAGQRRSSSRSYSRIGGGGTEGAAASAVGWDWKSAVARVVVWTWAGVASVAVTASGQEGEGLVSVAEIAGCVGSSVLGFLVPSIFFIALFHLRRPRSIFVSDPAVFATDALLLRKEREVQRRLSGRRLWQDVLVFGGLLPFSSVVLLRGIMALVKNDDW